MAYKKQEDANAASRRWRKNNPEKQSTIDKRAYKKKKENKTEKQKAMEADKTKRYTEKKRKILAEAKAKGCFMCGEKRLICLDFHHPNNNKHKLTVSEMLFSAGIPTLLKEIAKCVVVCSNCHRVIHEEERNAGLVTV